MSDDLTRLEDDLARGRLDATTFRRRRDALFAATDPGPGDRPAVAPDVGGVPGTPTAGNPFPPPFRWAPTRSDDDAAATPPDPTPIPPDPIPPARSAPDPTPPDPTPPDPTPPGVVDLPVAERTQVVPGARRPAPPVPAHATLPPWGLAPLAPPVRLDGVRRMQGAEVFVRPAPRGAGAVVGTAVVAALVLAVVLAAFLL